MKKLLTILCLVLLVSCSDEPPPEVPSDKLVERQGVTYQVNSDPKFNPPEPPEQLYLICSSFPPDSSFTYEFYIKLNKPTTENKFCLQDNKSNQTVTMQHLLEELTPEEFCQTSVIIDRNNNIFVSDEYKFYFNHEVTPEDEITSNYFEVTNYGEGFISIGIYDSVFGRATYGGSTSKTKEVGKLTIDRTDLTSNYRKKGRNFDTNYKGLCETTTENVLQDKHQEFVDIRQDSINQFLELKKETLDEIRNKRKI